MKQKVILRLTESDLHNIINNSVKKIIREMNNDHYSDDILDNSHEFSIVGEPSDNTMYSDEFNGEDYDNWRDEQNTEEFDRNYPYSEMSPEEMEDYYKNGTMVDDAEDRWNDMSLNDPEFSV